MLKVDQAVDILVDMEDGQAVILVVRAGARAADMVVIQVSPIEPLIVY